MAQQAVPFQLLAHLLLASTPSPAPFWLSAAAASSSRAVAVPAGVAAHAAASCSAPTKRWAPRSPAQYFCSAVPQGFAQCCAGWSVALKRWQPVHAAQPSLLAALGRRQRLQLWGLPVGWRALQPLAGRRPGWCPAGSAGPAAQQGTRGQEGKQGAGFFREQGCSRVGGAGPRARPASQGRGWVQAASAATCKAAHAVGNDQRGVTCDSKNGRTSSRGLCSTSRPALSSMTSSAKARVSGEGCGTATTTVHCRRAAGRV